MHTYCQWRNAHQRDYKIDDAAMLRFVLLLASSPLLVLLIWAHATYTAGRLLLRGRANEAIAHAILTPFFAIGEAPGYFKARWLQVTG